MSTWTVARVPRVAFVLASVTALVAGSLGMTAPMLGASPGLPDSAITPVGHLVPIALRPGSSTSTNRPVSAQPFRTLDDPALRAAKLHAAAVASRGQRGPLQAPHTPLAGIFNNTNGSGLNQLTVAPPDSTGAIGPNNYVEMVNQQIGVYDRSLHLISSSDNGTFMGAPSNLSVTDPQIQWDPQGGHWIYVALGVATGANMLLFGWSKTADPTDLTNGWCLFGTSRGNLLDDYPKLGHDDNLISVGTNVYDDSTNFTFLTANIFAIKKPQPGDASCTVGTVLYTSDAAHPLLNADGSGAFTPVPANTVDASPLGYIVAAHSPVDGVGTPSPKIMVWHWAVSGGSWSLVPDGDVSIPAFGVPAPVPQAGTTDVLDTLDARLTQAVADNDPGANGAKGIWTQHTVAGPDGRSIVRWYEILGGTPPTLRQTGDVSSPTDYIWNGAISPTSTGDSAAVFYNRGGGSVLPVIAAQSRSSATPLGSMDAGELVIAQSSAIDQDFTCQYSKPTDPCRWGDYAGATPDPVNVGVVWGSSQVTGPCYILCGFFAQWQTQNFAVVATTTSPPVPPGPPSLNTPTAGNGTVSLTWSAPASNGGAPITDYAVYRSTSTGTEAFLAKTGGALSFSDSGLTNGMTYFYKVAAINSAGTGTLSSERSATPTAPPVPPGPPNLNLLTAGNGTVSLTWSAPASNGGAPITDYAVYRSTTSGAEVLVANTGGPLSFADTNLTNGTTYYYKVAAINSAGTGTLSNERSATPATTPAAPSLNVPTAGNGSVGLTWSAPASNGGASITNYAVFRSTTSGGESQIATTGGALSYTDNSVTNGLTYFYKVAAINSVGTGALSNERSATPTAPPTPDFTVGVTPTSRTVSRGSSTTYTVTVTAANGFSGLVNLTASISPSATGVTMSYNPTGVTLGPPASGQSTLTITTNRTRTSRRTYTITIRGTSGSLVHSTTVTLTVK